MSCLRCVRFQPNWDCEPVSARTQFSERFANLQLPLDICRGAFYIACGAVDRRPGSKTAESVS